MKKVFVVIVFITSVFSLLAQNGIYRLLVGTYTNTGKSKGIYTYKVDINAAIFQQESITTGVSNPSFLAITPDEMFVYSVNDGDDGSGANAFSFDKLTGKLTFLNRSMTNGKGPCFISLTDKNVFTANYGGGSISVFGRNPDGSLTNVLQVIKHTGKSINSERQAGPHVHQVIVSPDKKYLIANDLGADYVTVYQYYPESVKNILVSVDSLHLKSGSGPRHAVFNRIGTKVYLVQELDGTVSVLSFIRGKLTLVQETTVDYNSSTINRAADIHLSPDERFLYVTNRGNANNITCFRVEKDGRLAFMQQIPTGGDGPRNFAITPDGKYVFIAHQFTDNITIMERNLDTGLLTDTRQQIQIGAPVCLKFY